MFVKWRYLSCQSSFSCSPVNTNREILCQLVPVVENHNQVDVELDFELFVDIRGAGVRSWEEHVEWNLEIGQHVAISDLNVLNLRRIRLAFERLHANELNLNRLNLDFRLL